MTDELREAMEYGRRRLHRWRLNDPTKIAKELRCIRALLSRIDALENALVETLAVIDGLYRNYDTELGPVEVEVVLAARAALDGGEGEKDA